MGTLGCDPDYFSLKVKTQRKDLYDREEELGLLEKSAGLPITVVTGIRRVGKSSVVSVFLSGEARYPCGFEGDGAESLNEGAF